MQLGKVRWPGGWLITGVLLSTCCGAVLTADRALAQVQNQPEISPTAAGADLPDTTLLQMDPALAGADSLGSESLQQFIPWSPVATDSVLTAVAASVATLDSVLAAHGEVEAAGAPVFARVRADGGGYWYEIVLGPFPAVAELDTALGAWPGQRGAGWAAADPTQPVWGTWERQSRGMVAPPQLLSGGPAAPPIGNEVDAIQGG